MVFQSLCLGKNQIYNEKLFDLFQDKDSGKPLNIREDKYTGIFVEGQSEYVVTTA
jgi:hypothetical protein